MCFLQIRNFIWLIIYLDGFLFCQNDVFYVKSPSSQMKADMMLRWL